MKKLKAILMASFCLPACLSAEQLHNFWVQIYGKSCAFIYDRITGSIIDKDPITGDYILKDTPQYHKAEYHCMSPFPLKGSNGLYGYIGVKRVYDDSIVCSDTGDHTAYFQTVFPNNVIFYTQGSVLDTDSKFYTQYTLMYSKSDPNSLPYITVKCFSKYDHGAPESKYDEEDSMTIYAP